MPFGRLLATIQAFQAVGSSTTARSPTDRRPDLLPMSPAVQRVELRLHRTPPSSKDGRHPAAAPL